tara:strand:- start:11519 stop:12169 length:651 start_codon:yes stop_codon:yes gene_type:complete
MSKSSFLSGNFAPLERSVTLAKMASGTDGNLITYDASGNPAHVATGSAGQVLTSAGAGAPPTFAGGGKLLQTVTTVKLDAFSATATSMTDVTGLSVQITPSATSSKILVTGAITGAGSHFVWFRVLRDSTQLQIPASLSNRTTGSIVFQNSETYMVTTLPISILDSPSSTSTLTYKVQCEVYSGSGYVNRTERDDDNAAGYDARGSSSITVQEIGA